MKVAVALTARPSYAKLKSIIEGLLALGVDVTLLACASALLERYGRVISVVRQDFPALPVIECWSAYEGANLVTSAKETGALLIELAGVLSVLKPDCVLVMADRHEILAVAQAASYLHIPLAHCQSGEKTGSIDDKVRDAVTALATYHFPCTEQAKFRVTSLTGAYDRVWNFGCSAVDLAKRAQDEPPVTEDELGGAGAVINLSTPFLILLQHPVTDEAEHAYAQMWETLRGLPDMPTVCLWPGQDAGSEGVSKAIREYQELYGTLHTVRNLPPTRFLRLMSQCAVMVGNSSAGIRESAFLGVPVVDIGTRQRGRERAKNVTWAPYQAHAIRQAIERQRAHGRYPSSALYGRGDSGQKIAETLREICDNKRSGESATNTLAPLITPRAQEARRHD
jgi:UDP-hydrolysing UDP-N-acetyl-D-glucosamine 2-epimerase